jgi:hypothetical protein
MCHKRGGVKILFDHNEPFFLAHGGFQSQIEQTRLGLEKAGLEVEWLRWWDHAQSGDVIHYFGAARSTYLQYSLKFLRRLDEES